MLGYSENDVIDMLESVGNAYELINEPADLKQGLYNTFDFLKGLLVEGHI
jgi:hypothetical protein